MKHPSQPEADARRRGRRVAIALFGGFVALFIAIASFNVIQQIFAPSSLTQPVGSCSDELRGLVHALERAREAASEIDEADETAALSRFRLALQPEWGRHALIVALCRNQREMRDALDTIERLRYAEEHAVRLEASELAPLRLAVRKLMNERLGASAK